LALAWPDLATRQMWFDFIVDELLRCEPENARRIRPVRVALRNQRDDLLDGKLTAVALAQGIAEPLVREACILHRLPSTSCVCWRG
jgi:hypothetical protein